MGNMNDILVDAVWVDPIHVDTDDPWSDTEDPLGDMNDFAMIPECARASNVRSDGMYG